MSHQTIIYSGQIMQNNTDVELKKLTLEKDLRGYYLAATYRIEDKHSIREIDIPKIRLMQSENAFTINLEDNRLGFREGYINFGFGNLQLDKVLDENAIPYFYTERVLEEKYTEMTLDEIEKKLGHKIKIVSKRKE